MNEWLDTQKGFEEFKEKVIEEIEFLDYIANDEKLDIYRSEEDNQVSIWLHPKEPYNQSTRGEYVGDCKYLVYWIEDELNIVTDGLEHINIDNYDYELYKINIFYDEIENEVEEIISKVEEILDNYGRKHWLEYTNNNIIISL